MIADLIAGRSLDAAISSSRETLVGYPGHEECLRALDAAARLAAHAPPTPESVETLGRGWVGEEALAIALFCSLGSTTFEVRVALAVTHGGDSDSTGAITGNILGCLYGRQAIPARWLEPLELRAEIGQVASDVFLHVGDPSAVDSSLSDRERYPPG